MASTLEMLLRKGPATATGGEGMASALRDQNLLGRVMQLSGHSRVAPLGQQLSGEAMNMAKIELARRDREREAQRQQSNADRMYGLAERRLANQQQANSLQAAGLMANMQTKSNKETQRQMEKFSKMYNDAGLPRIMTSISVLEGKLGDYFKGGRQVKDVPGFGKTGFLPAVALTDEGKQIRSEWASLQNTISSALFGASQTDPELRRLANEMIATIGTVNKDSDLTIALPILKRQFTAVRDHMAAPYLESGAAQKVLTQSGAPGFSEKERRVDLAGMDFSGYESQ